MAIPELLPPVWRHFKAADIATSLDCIKARPGFSKARGGVTLPSGATHDTQDSEPVGPMRLRVETNDVLVWRVYFDDAKTMYYDTWMSLYAGELLEWFAHEVLHDATIDGAVRTTACDFSIAWRR